MIKSKIVPHADIHAKPNEVIILDPKYQQIGTFPPFSKLHEYLAKRKRSIISPIAVTYRVCTVLMAVKEIIEEEELFDPLNREIIILNTELEEALRVKYIHIYKLKVKLESILIGKHKERLLADEVQIQKEVESMKFWEFYPKLDEDQLSIESDKKGEFRVSEQLFKLIKVALDKPMKGRVLTYRKICHLMTSYVSMKESIFVDYRSTYIIDLRHDLLGVILRKNFVTKRQLMMLVQQHLTKHIRVKRSSNYLGDPGMAFAGLDDENNSV
jgi:hypothetical protein